MLATHSFHNHSRKPQLTQSLFDPDRFRLHGLVESDHRGPALVHAVVGLSDTLHVQDADAGKILKS